MPKNKSFGTICDLRAMPLFAHVEPQETNRVDQITFCSIGSGSSGNAYLLSSNDGHILLDVGLPLRYIARVLKDVNLSFGQLSAVLVTHSHSDHVRSLARLSQLYNLPIYASVAAFTNIDKRKNDKPIRSAYRYHLYPFQSVNIAGFDVEAFPIPHDSNDCLGFFFQKGEFSLTHLSDVGSFLDVHYTYARKSNHLVLEANYDREMLLRGSYPYHLKQRIIGSGGHASNQESALFLKKIYSAKLRKVWLCHISKENNHPDCCRSTFEQLLSDTVTDRPIFNDLIEILPRLAPSNSYSFRIYES